MGLSQRYEHSDAFAGACARAALDSIDDPFTLEMLCRALHCPMPVSADDLRQLALLCARWKIRTVLDGDMTSWNEYQKEVRKWSADSFTSRTVS